MSTCVETGPSKSFVRPASCRLLTECNMKNPTSDLPLELQPFASLLDAQPPEVQEAFQFLLATAKSAMTTA